MRLGPFQQSQYGQDFGGTLAADQAAAEVNEFMWKTYRWMSLGLAITGLTAWTVANTPSIHQVIFGNPLLFWGMVIAQLGVVIAFSAVATRLSTTVAAAIFLGYSALTGLTLASIFMMYTSASIASTFFVTAGSFAGLSIYGATTKRDLSGLGRFMFFGLIGLILASVVNIFVASSALYWITTYAGVLIFAGLTAYENQKLRQMYREFGEGGNLALRGALILYLDFINLFLYLLRLMGERR